MSSTAAIRVVPVLSFELPYKLSDVTDDLRAKIQRAMAAALSVDDPGAVILTFSAASLPLGRRLQQESRVLVAVGLFGFVGSVSQLQSKVRSRLAWPVCVPSSFCPPLLAGLSGEHK